MTKCVETYNVSTDNYEAARDTIYDRFGDIKLAEEQHVDTLVNACIRKETDTDAKFIEFVDIITHNTAALVNLGHTTYEGMSVMLSRMVLNALPYERKTRFDDKYESDGDCELEGLISFLGQERKQTVRLAEKQKGALKLASRRKTVLVKRRVWFRSRNLMTGNLVRTG